MNMEELTKENSCLKEEMVKLNNELERIKQELVETKEHLKKYTAPIAKKIYYENNKESIKLKVKEYNYIKSPEQVKEYNKRAYEKRKANKAEEQNVTIS
jgi:dynactin complex subunit